jgi:hypothetical protein
VDLFDEDYDSVDVHRVKNSVFLNSGVRIQATLGRDGYREFKSDMLIDANGTTGPFAVCRFILIIQWASECNDFRQDPIRSIEHMYKIESIDEGMSANLDWVHFWILVCTFLMDRDGRMCSS